MRQKAMMSFESIGVRLAIRADARSQAFLQQQKPRCEIASAEPQDETAESAGYRIA
jgi:hypothetical protein